MAVAYSEARWVVSGVGPHSAHNPHRRQAFSQGLGLALALTTLRLTPARAASLQEPEALLGLAQSADWLLLGELHDQPEHHRVRAQLLQSLKPEILVFEQLPLLPEPVRLLADQPLLPQLEALGFDAKAWGWPLHEPIFQIAASLATPILGGNLTQKQLRAASRQGLEALSPELQQGYASLAPLTDSGLSALKQDLRVGHCNMLPEVALPGMVMIQRIRDLCMAQSMAKGQRAVLIAGNGHVRKDYGVPQILQQQADSRRVVSIGFTEAGEDGLEAAEQMLYDGIWITSPLERPDPCEAFRSRQARTSGGQQDLS